MGAARQERSQSDGARDATGTGAPVREESSSTPGRPLCPSAILRLQRAAGNRVTSQVLRTAARRIQRNVGFEFEANWHASWYDAKESGGILDQSAFSRDTLSKGGKLPTFKPIPKATKIISAKDVDLTADEAGNASDIEYVTVPFPETKAGRAALEKAMKKVAEANTKLEDNDQPFTPTDSLSTIGKVKLRNAVIKRGNTGKINGSPQVTGGIRLEALADMVKTMTEKNEQGSSVARKDLAGMGNESDADVLGSAVTDAETAPSRWIAWKAGPEPEGEDVPDDRPRIPIGSRSLVGLTTIVISYLRRGNTKQTSYAKNIAPIMARTDFAAMFKLLPKEERTYLQSDGGKTFAEYVMFAANLAGTGDTPVFRMGLKYYGQTNEHVLDALTRDKWLTGIANGIDYMTASNIEKLVQGSGKEMESLGRLGSKQDKVSGGGTAPVFELRRLRQSIPAAEWTELALRIFDFVVDTNDKRGVGKTTAY